MKTQASKSAPNPENRCRHRTPTGRRCRKACPSPNAKLCLWHRAMADKPQLEDVSADLAARLKDIRVSLQTTEGVCNALAELYVLLAQDRISPRRASVLAYVSSLLLRTLRETGGQEPRSEIKFIFGKGPKDDVTEVTDESQLTEYCPGALYTVRNQYLPRPKGITQSESDAIDRYEQIST